MQLNWRPATADSVHELPEQWPASTECIWKKLGAIALDVLFLRGYYRRDRRLWSVLYLFHGGLYLLILWHVWLFVRAAVGITSTASHWGIIWGHLATTLVFLGAVGIPVFRAANCDLRASYPPIHFVKWVVMVLTMAAGFYAVQVYFGGDPSRLLQYVSHQLEFNLKYKINAPVPTSTHLLLAVPWLIYLPYSHITRMFFRNLYVLRWDGRQNAPANTISRHVPELMHSRLSWSAPHVQSASRWEEAVTKLPQDSKRTGLK
jgi:nitrate reductase gamma subunit